MICGELFFVNIKKLSKTLTNILIIYCNKKINKINGKLLDLNSPKVQYYKSNCRLSNFLLPIKLKLGEIR